MINNGLGKYLKIARKDKGLTAEKLSELCHINATYLRQIEGGTKTPSLSVLIDLCNALEISPNYLLQDSLEVNEVSKIRDLEILWENASPKQQEIAAIIIQAILKYIDSQK